MNQDKFFINLFRLIKSKKTYRNETNLDIVADREKLIRKTSFINSDSKRMYIFITGWYEKNWHSCLLKKRLELREESYINYSFAPCILSSRYKEVPKNMNFIKKTVLEDIKKYKDRRIILICSSLGVTQGIMISSSCKYVRKIVLLMPYDSLADVVFEGIRTKKIKKSIEAQGIIKSQLKKAWYFLEPKNNVEGLKDKEIMIYISKQDTITPYKSGLIFIRNLRKKGISPVIITSNNLGHHLTAFKFYNSRESLEKIN